MNNRIDAIYARQSVDKKDSISIESQIEFCKYELKGGNCKEYTDKGYSGKNTDRPMFQELVRDIKRGLIAKVVVYKLDRISRSILDFANMMELFQQYNVEFVSSTEKFDTSTPMGRAMLIIFSAIPVWNSAEPITIIAASSTMVLPEKALNRFSFGSTPANTRATAPNMEVRANGSLSVTKKNAMIVSTMSEMIAGAICYPLLP